MKKKDRNKNIVVGVLLVAALATVSSQFLGGRFRRRVAPVRAAANAVPDLPATATAAAASSSSNPSNPAADANTAAGAPLDPERPIDLPIVLSQFTGWIESPQRDPFQTFVPPPPKVEGPRAVDVLALRGIWRQSGAQFAVVNNQVLTEGDSIQSFRIEKIEASTVWVRGTNGAERLDFQVGAPPPPPPQPNQPPGRRIPGGGIARERRLSP